MENKVEIEVQTFWRLSRAWRRDPRFLNGVTFHSLITDLEPLIKNGSDALKSQADELADMAVRGKIRRKKGTIKGKVLHVDFTLKTNNFSPKEQATKRYA